MYYCTVVQNVLCKRKSCVLRAPLLPPPFLSIHQSVLTLEQYISTVVQNVLCKPKSCVHSSPPLSPSSQHPPPPPEKTSSATTLHKRLFKASKFYLYISNRSYEIYKRLGNKALASISQNEIKCTNFRD